MKRVITFGTFDLLHEGHINILRRAKEEGDYLIVGISSDSLNAKKGKVSYFPQEQRLSYISALKFVDEAFIEESLEDKDNYIKEFKADLLVMGDDWSGKFDWVSCETKYLSRTEGVSSTQLKSSIADVNKPKVVLFGDTYIKKHYECALTIINQLISNNVCPIITNEPNLPTNFEPDALVYFNLPVNPPPPKYSKVPRVLVDHGASNLKWFLANIERFRFFDTIITAGVDHTRSLLSFFSETYHHKKIENGGFIKSEEVFSKSHYSRDEICKMCGLDSEKPIILFAPTWHKGENKDLNQAIISVSKVPNHVASLHPETYLVNTDRLNVAPKLSGITLELMKHADVVISDLSSTIFEAASLGIPCVQFLLREYPDNPSLIFDYPYAAGTSELFCGGVTCKPSEIDLYVEAINNDLVLEAISACQKRVLQGTSINKDCADSIANLLKLETLDARSILREELSNEKYYANLVQVEARRKLLTQKVISHGGGNYCGMRATNTKEALESSLNTLDIVELDIVAGRDGLLVAHDGLERSYQLDRPFSEVSETQFLESKFSGELTPISVEQCFELLVNKRKYILFDIKAIGKEYQSQVSELVLRASAHGVLEKVMVQCYCYDDFKFALTSGVKNIILAVWKYYYKDPLGTDSYNFITDCMALDSNKVVGISIPFSNVHMSKSSLQDLRILKFKSFWKRIFLHGVPFEFYEEALSNNYGLFIDAIDKDCELKDIPSNFEWLQYSFLNPAKSLDNWVAAVKSFIRDKGKETIVRFDLPPNFSWQKYLKANPDLVQNGVNNEMSAKSHWTRFGQHEGRQY